MTLSQPTHSLPSSLPLSTIARMRPSVSLAGIDLLCHVFCKLSPGASVSSMRAFPASQTVVAVQTNGYVQTIAPPLPTAVTNNKNDLISNINNKIDQCSSEDESSDQQRQRLLGLSLVWLLADVYGLVDVHESMLHSNASMFGYKGRDNILSFKRQLLTQQEVNYHVNAIHQIDLDNRAVVADFDCLIPGKEGRGTDVVKFTEDWKVMEVQAIRHGVSMEWSTPSNQE